MNHHLRWGHLDWCKVISYPDWTLGAWNPDSDSCRFPRIKLAQRGFDMVQSCLIQPPRIRIGSTHERWDSHHHPNGFVHKWDMHPKNKDPQIHCFMIILVEIAISFWGLHGFAPFSDRSKWAKAVWEFANSVGECCSGEAKDDELSHPTSRPRAAPLDFPHKAWTAAYGLRKELFGPLLMCSLPEDRESCNTGGVVTIIVRYWSVHSDLKAMGVNKHVDTMIDSGTHKHQTIAADGPFHWTRTPAPNDQQIMRLLGDLVG